MYIDVIMFIRIYSTFFFVVKMNNTTNGDFLQDVESFLYTPLGLGALAGATALLTSCLWLLCCSVACCCIKWRNKRRQSGTIEAGADLKYMTCTEFRPPQYSSATSTENGYHSNAGTLSSLNRHDALAIHSSMDAILN